MKPKKNIRNYPVFGAPTSLRANRFNQYKCKILTKRWFSDKRGDCAYLGRDGFSSLGFWMGKITFKTVVPPFCRSLCTSLTKRTPPENYSVEDYFLLPCLYGFRREWFLRKLPRLTAPKDFRFAPSRPLQGDKILLSSNLTHWNFWERTNSDSLRKGLVS